MEILSPLAIAPLPSPSPWHLPLCFLSPWICPFWTFPINGITYCVAFCVYLISLTIMSSRFIHTVICQCFIPFYGCITFHRVHRRRSLYPCICSFTFGLFPSFGHCKQCCSEHLCASIGGPTSSSFRSIPRSGVARS